MTQIRVTDSVLVPNVKRMGLNIGSRDIYGAAQIIKNLVPNPGFENAVFGSIIHADKGATTKRVPQAFWDTSWNNDQYGIGQPAGFWAGGEFEVVYGPGKGRSGRISGFTLENNHYAFYLTPEGPAPAEWDALFVRTELPGMAIGPHMNQDIVDTSTTRPGSSGIQSLHLKGSSAIPEYALYLDSEWRDGDKTAGKLLRIHGNYRVAFWAKGRSKDDRIHVRFYRDGSPDFYDEVIALDPEWKLYDKTFSVAEDADRLTGFSETDNHPILTFRMTVEQKGGEAWVDDLSVASSDDANPTAFTDAFVNLLKEYRPGVLRDWSSQLGETLDNQLAEPFARKSVGFSPKTRCGGNYNYSLHEFLELCRTVGAEPWYVIPPTFSKRDLKNLLEYLSDQADGMHPYADRRARLGQTAPWTDVFNVIHLEFGNEMWGTAASNDPFFGGSALGGERLGAIANDRFAILKTSRFYNAGKFDLIIGGQASYPDRQGEIQAASTAHDSAAIAPYFGDLEDWSSPQAIYGPLFARAFEDVRSGTVRKSLDALRANHRATRLAIYEINFHTTSGPAPLTVRNPFVSGADGAIALPLYMLTYLRDAGVTTQCAFNSLQYSFKMENGDHVRLWGMLRDVASTGVKRPTWLGVELANQAIRGDLVATEQTGSNLSWLQESLNGVGQKTSVNYIQPYAFRDGPAGSVILFNLNLAQSLKVKLNLPFASGSALLRQIAPEQITDTNEEKVTVVPRSSAIAVADGSVALELPKHSISAILWPAGPQPKNP